MDYKKKFTINQQIKHMKSQGIKFSLFSEREAAEFLKNNNYYFKVKSFAKNYNKVNNKYEDLEFQYLRKFSILDTFFRDIVLEISLLCEHILKTNICYLSSINEYDDGYNIVTSFLYHMQEEQDKKQDFTIKMPKTLSIYDMNKSLYYSKDMLNKYRLKLPIWVFIEILSFGELIDFYQYYIKKYGIPRRNTINLFDLYTIKSIRNVAAHNSCILHTLTMPPIERFRISNQLKNFLQSKNLLTRTGKDLKVPIIHDFLCLIFIYNQICKSVKTRIAIKNKIKDFLAKCEKHPEYFCKNNIIKNRYEFIKKSTLTILS